MKAITTKFYGPGNVKGSRYGASDEDGNKVIVPTDFSLGSAENHDAAAIALCAKMGWTGKLHRGGTKGGYVYVWENDAEGWLIVEPTFKTKIG